MLPISISNSRDLQRSDAKLSSDRSVQDASCDESCFSRWRTH